MRAFKIANILVLFSFFTQLSCSTPSGSLVVVDGRFKTTIEPEKAYLMVKTRVHNIDTFSNNFTRKIHFYVSTSACARFTHIIDAMKNEIPLQTCKSNEYQLFEVRPGKYVINSVLVTRTGYKTTKVKLKRDIWAKNLLPGTVTYVGDVIISTNHDSSSELRTWVTVLPGCESEAKQVFHDKYQKYSSLTWIGNDGLT